MKLFGDIILPNTIYTRVNLLRSLQPKSKIKIDFGRIVQKPPNIWSMNDTCLIYKYVWFLGGNMRDNASKRFDSLHLFIGLAEFLHF